MPTILKAILFTALGAAVALLLSPNSGEDNRKAIKKRASKLLNK